MRMIKEEKKRRKGGNSRKLTAASGKSDPYLIADAGGCQARTRTIHKNLSPFWGEDYSLYAHSSLLLIYHHLTYVTSSVIGDHFANDPMANIKITVWDEDRYTKDTLLGQVNIPLNSLGDGKVHEQVSLLILCI